ncbi:translation initiation factor 2 [Paenibacillus dendritiformis]|uniref:translation initiation factor 2 n=1 Tax=Paenibacillus dendritiformis TaxID=130049 RepID=UPI00143D5721|nr:translation initiation factor 2 [Paenibacillus dendritiformis]NKI21116.1 translation initiation factor 2 [Paenibacillus dendritiformis]NRF96677.1 translation initiation factor 2 [Paenibacillus dendritiformis]
MSRFAKQVAGMMVLLVVGVFIGMEVTSVSIERIYGPADANRSSVPADSAWPERPVQEPLASRPAEPEPVQGREAAVPDNPPQEWLPEAAPQPSPVLPPVEDAAVNKLADQTAGLLQTLSQAGIRAVVGLFDGLF